MSYSHATRLLAPLAAAALLAVPAGIALGSSHARAAAPAPSVPPKAGSTSAVVQTCHVGLQPTDRYAVFSAQMASVHSSTTMAVRFDLYGAVLTTTPAASSGGPTGPGVLGPVRHLSAPSLGTWNRSAPGVTIFDYNQTVASLPYGDYRAIVHYRWYSRNGRVIRRTHRETTLCAQPDQRPNLVAGAVNRQPAGVPKTTSYGVTVHNRGATAAGAFDVSLTIDGTPVAPNQTVPGLDAAARTVVTFTGPRCTAGQTLQVSVDPAGRVDESNKADDTRSITC